MTNSEYERRVAAIKAWAQGRWPELLAALGVAERILSKRNIPCPDCGGKDRFQFTDKFGHGDAHCRNCGHWDGFKLAMVCRGMSFNEVVDALERMQGALPDSSRKVADRQPAARMRQLAKRIWSEARPVVAGDEVDRYLSRRGLHLDDYPKALRFHPSLGYYVKREGGKSVKVAAYPAMLAVFQDRDGNGTTLHRTYLCNGAKARLGRDAKKCLSAGVDGAAIRLFNPVDGELAVAEGIETALAVHKLTGKPVWAAYAAGNLEKLWIPDTVQRLFIYADNDAAKAYDGQASAYILARRVMKESAQQHKAGTRATPLQVEVRVPQVAGNDWADVLKAHLEAQPGRRKQAA